MPNTSTTDEGKALPLTAEEEQEYRSFFKRSVSALRLLATIDAERAKVAELEQQLEGYRIVTRAWQRDCANLEAERDAAFAKGRAEGIEAAASLCERGAWNLDTPLEWAQHTELLAAAKAIRALKGSGP